MTDKQLVEVDHDYWVVKRGWNPCAGLFVTLEVVELRDENQGVHVDAHWVMPMAMTAVSFKRLVDNILVGARKTRRDMRRLIHALGKDVASRVSLRLVAKLIMNRGAPQ